MIYKCPICQTELVSATGSRTRDYGVTLFCPSQTCDAQEVISYGKNVKDAYQVILDKYKK